MDYPLIINFKRFSVYRYIKNQGKVDMENPGAVAKEAREVWGIYLSAESCRYIRDNFRKLERKFNY